MRKTVKRILATLLTTAIILGAAPLMSFENLSANAADVFYDLKISSFLDSIENDKTKKSETEYLNDGGFAIYPDMSTILNYRIVIASQSPSLKGLTVNEVSCYYNQDFIINSVSEYDYQQQGTVIIDGKTYNKICFKNISLPIDGSSFGRVEISMGFETPLGYGDIFGNNFYCEITDDDDNYTDNDSVPGNAISNGTFNLEEDDAKGFINEYNLIACPYGLKYEITNNKTINIIGYIGESDVNSLYIPSKVNNNPVKGIANYAFQNSYNSFEKVYLPSTISTINQYAFYPGVDSFKSLKEIHISESNDYTWIGNTSFYSLGELQYINLPSTTTGLGPATIIGSEGERYSYYSSVLSYGLYRYKEEPNPSLIQIDVIKDSYADSYLRNIKNSNGNETFTDLINYSEKIYTVHYDHAYNGGNWNVVDTRLAKGGESIDLSLHSIKDGYKFIGWNTNPNATVALTSLKMGDSDVTLYPIYQKTTYTLQYNAKGGSVSPTSVVIEDEKTTTLPTPTKSYKITYNANGGSVSSLSKTVNCTFKNWNTNASGTGTSYSAGTNYTVTADTTLYAQWNNPTAGTLATPTRTDYTFDGWYTAATGGTKVTSSSTISANTTLYAHWTAIENDIYNLGEETYSFANFGDSDSAGGHCFGMSMTSAGYYLNYLDITDVGGNKTDDVYGLNKTNAVQKPICYYQVRQPIDAIQKINVAGGYMYETFDDVSGYCYVNVSSDWSEIVNYVKGHNYDNKGSLALLYHSAEGGHAVNFLRYEEVDGQQRVYVYDNNFPNIETYFYKNAYGQIVQAPKHTLTSIYGLTLVSVEEYYKIADDIDVSRFIYANANEITVEGALINNLVCSSTDGKWVIYEIPEGIDKVQIKATADNASFVYLDNTYSFGKTEQGSIGVLNLSTTLPGLGATEPSFDIVDKTLTEIKIVSAPSNVNLTYKNGASLDGLQVIAKYSDGSEVDVTDKVNVTGFDTNSTGDKTATVEFEGQTATFNYSVSYAWWQWIIIILLFGWIWY